LARIPARIRRVSRRVPGAYPGTAHIPARIPARIRRVSRRVPGAYPGTSVSRASSAAPLPSTPRHARFRRTERRSRTRPCLRLLRAACARRHLHSPPRRVRSAVGVVSADRTSARHLAREWVAPEARCRTWSGPGRLACWRLSPPRIPLCSPSPASAWRRACPSLPGGGGGREASLTPRPRPSPEPVQ